MKIFIEVHHPAHVHFFRNAVYNWLSRGDEVLIAGRDRGIMQGLLDVFNLPGRILTSKGSGIIGASREFFLRQIRVAREISSFKPDVVLSLMGVYAQTARILRVPSIVFTDSEHQTVSHRIAHPFASLICTPSCFRKNLGKKQLRYNGYHELAYLHPRRFTPDPGILRKAGVSPDEDFFIVRFISWDTLHDIGQRGFRGSEKLRLLKLLEENGRVFVSSEGSAPPEFKRYRLPVGPENVHHFLYFARMYVGEGATMASESAILGTPSVFVNTLSLGYLDELETEYGLVFCHKCGEDAFRSVREIMLTERSVFRERRQKMLKDKIDVTAFVLELVDSFIHRRGAVQSFCHSHE